MINFIPGKLYRVNRNRVHCENFSGFITRGEILMYIQTNTKRNHIFLYRGKKIVVNDVQFTEIEFGGETKLTFIDHYLEEVKL